MDIQPTHSGAARCDVYPWRYSVAAVQFNEGHSRVSRLCRAIQDCRLCECWKRRNRRDGLDTAAGNIEQNTEWLRTWRRGIHIEYGLPQRSCTGILSVRDHVVYN